VCRDLAAHDAVAIHRMGRRLRVRRDACSGRSLVRPSQWGTLREYSRGCRLHAPLVLSRVAGPAARCGNKQARLRRQRQQAMRRCGWEQPGRCALLSRSAKPVATVPCRTWACARWMDREERTAGRGLRKQTTPSLPSAAVTCAKQRCAHIRTCAQACTHFCALPHLPRGPFRDAERLGAVQRAGAAEGISRDGRAPTGSVARPRAPLGQAVRALHVRRYHTLSTNSGHTAHHSARPCGPSHSQQCAAGATAVAACCTETRPTALRRHVVGLWELRVPIWGTLSA
jgi:hypothetical protein